MKAEGKGKPCFTFPRRISCCFIGTLSQTLTLRAAFASSTYLLSQIPGPGRSSDDDLLNPPPAHFSRGDQGLRAFHRRNGFPCPPASARNLMTCLNPPNPLFKGAHQASVRTRAHATASLFFGRHLRMSWFPKEFR